MICKIVFLGLFILVTALAGRAATAYDPALNRDPLPLKNYNNPTPSAESSGSQSGLRLSGDGFAGDMLHLVTGINRPLEPGVSLNMSLQNQFRLGVNF